MYRSSLMYGNSGSQYRGRSVINRGTATFSDRPVGLENLTNTCYISAVLQQLFPIIPDSLRQNKGRITELFLQLKASKGTRQFQLFKREISKCIPILQGYEQQDAQEFLIGLLEVLGKENSQPLKQGEVNLDYNPKLDLETNYKNFMSEMLKLENNQIVSLFSGEFIKIYSCVKGHKKYKFQRYQCMSLNFPKTDRSSFYDYSWMSQKSVSLKEMLKQEVAEKINGLMCEKCGSNTDFECMTFTYTLPKYLILHLVRFKQSYYSQEKINTVIQYNELLTLKCNSSDKNVKYRLIGTVNHYGTLGRGHYYAQLRYKDDKWYEINDDDVRTCRIQQTGNRSKYVYLMFYQRLN